MLAKAEAEASPEERERLDDLLMMDHWLVQDILPPAPPPEPADWSAPEPRQYEEPAASLLEIGPVLEVSSLEGFAEELVWEDAEARRELVRMATDPGLFGTWRGKPESWAPYHAMTMLALLDAHELIGELRPIVDPTDWDDWYGDHLLAECLGMMGPEVEPFTWSLIRDRELDAELRGLALLGLQERAEMSSLDRAGEVAEQIADFLQADDPDDPDRKTVNAYAAYVLRRECFPEEISESAIQQADEAGLIDHAIFDPQDYLDFDPRDL